MGGTYLKAESQKKTLGSESLGHLLHATWLCCCMLSHFAAACYLALLLHASYYAEACYLAFLLHVS